MYSVLQKNIKKHLQQKNISVTELERRAGLKHAVINIIHGRSKNPSAKVTCAIAKELDCSVEDLFKDSENIPATAQAHNSPDWEEKILVDCVLAINNTIKSTDLKPNIDVVLGWIKQAFCYAQSEPSKQVEARFIEWLITNYPETQN